MDKGLLIIGAGGHGKVIADIALQTGAWPRLAFLDSDHSLPGELMGIPILREVGDIRKLQDAYSDAAVAVGNCAQRARLMEDFNELGFSLPVVRHPSAIVSRYAEIGAGSQIMAMSVINTGARTGNGCLINTSATVDHDCTLGDCVHVSPGAHLAGEVTVSDRTWIGLGACVREHCRIGHDVTIGAGAVVVADVTDGRTVVGNPAKPIRANRI